MSASTHKTQSYPKVLGIYYFVASMIQSTLAICRSMRLLLRFMVCHVMIIYLSPSGVYVTINACLKGPSVPQSELRYRLNYQHYNDASFPQSQIPISKLSLYPESFIEDTGIIDSMRSNRSKEDIVVSRIVITRVDCIISYLSLVISNKTTIRLLTNRILVFF